MRSTTFSILCINLRLLSGCHAFMTTPRATPTTKVTMPTNRVVSDVVVGSPVVPSATNTSSSTSSSTNNNQHPNSLTWESKQHLYGVDMIHEVEMSNSMSVTLDADGEVAGGASGGGESLPLPQTYITCGKCNSLFAIAEEDLGKGKGW